MAQLDARARDRLRRDQFAYVDRSGGEHLPIHDEAHIRAAMARWNQTDFQSRTSREAARRKIVAAARRHGIEVSPDDHVAHPVGATR
jgi:hypothetical protein